MFGKEKIINRTDTHVVEIGNVKIGGYNEIAIQTMTTSKTSDVKETLKQINELYDYGADLMRVSVLDEEDVKALPEIVKGAKCPIIADIHYNWKFAISAIQAKVAKIRINPGNIGLKENVLEIINEAKKHNTAIRIGINGGSLKFEPNYSHVDQLVNCAFEWIKFFEKNKFTKLVVSIKDSNPNITYKANLALAAKCKYPIHIGVTEAGPNDAAIIKSCIGLVPLLDKGVGSTIRISINGNRKQEIRACQILLNGMGFNNQYYNIVACPLCGRNLYNTNKWVEEIDKFLQDNPVPIKIGIMGCVVNGPGEAKDCDIAICVKDKKTSMLYTKGKIEEIENDNVITTLKDLINKKI